MKIIKSSNLSLESTYNAIEIEQKLNDLSSFNPDKKRYFSGKVNSDRFKFYPEFDYGSRSLLRPEISGIIYPSEDNTRLDIHFDIPSHTKFFL